MYAKLLAAAPEGGVSRATPLDEKRQKQHVQRQIPSMVIEIDKGEDKDFIIEVDNPYPQIGVEIVSSKPTTGTVSNLVKWQIIQMTTMAVHYQQMWSVIQFLVYPVMCKS